MNTFVFVDLVKTSMESQFLSFISKLTQDVVDLKSFIKGYYGELVGLSNMHIFMFSLITTSGLFSSTKIYT